MANMWDATGLHTLQKAIVVVAATLEPSMRTSAEQVVVVLRRDGEKSGLVCPSTSSENFKLTLFMAGIMFLVLGYVQVVIFW